MQLLILLCSQNEKLERTTTAITDGLIKMYIPFASVQTLTESTWKNKRTEEFYRHSDRVIKCLGKNCVFRENVSECERSTNFSTNYSPEHSNWKHVICYSSLVDCQIREQQKYHE